MSHPFTILIADRNRHVREFLRRELEAEGYRVRIAKDGQKLLMMVNLDDRPDLVILDPEIPYGGELAILDQINKKDPPLPIIIHTFLTEYASHPSIERVGAFVEKRGNIDHLKEAVSRVLQTCYPGRYGYAGEDGSPPVKKGETT
jgi:DNA-binding NtrC family response regulator